MKKQKIKLLSMRLDQNPRTKKNVKLTTWGWSKLRISLSQEKLIHNFTLHHIIIQIVFSVVHSISPVNRYSSEEAEKAFDRQQEIDETTKTLFTEFRKNIRLKQTFKKLVRD